MKDWNTYIEKTKKLKERDLLVKAVALLHETRGNALDLGAGGMRDSRYLAKIGFKVTAVDSHASIIENSHSHNITPSVCSIEDFLFKKQTYTIINAAYSLPFVHPDNFSDVFCSLTQSLVSGGVLVAQFFGQNDTWHKDTEMTFHNRADILDLVTEYHIHYFDEKEFNGSTANDTEKHWHIFDIIAQKK